MHKINRNRELYSASNKGIRLPTDFEAFTEWAVGLGLEIGCGSNRFSNTVVTVDRGIDGDADIICDAAKLPFNDRTFDFVFSAHCLKDFKEPLPVMKEWLRVIKPAGKLLLLLPNMENVEEFSKVAGFKSTIKSILEMIEKCPARLETFFEFEVSTSFGVVIERLPTSRDEYKLVCTPYGRAVKISEKDGMVKVVYPDRTQKDIPEKDVTVQANCRYPDLLSYVGGS